MTNLTTKLKKYAKIGAVALGLAYAGNFGYNVGYEFYEGYKFETSPTGILIKENREEQNSCVRRMVEIHSYNGENKEIVHALARELSIEAKILSSLSEKEDNLRKSPIAKKRSENSEKYGIRIINPFYKRV